MAPRRKIQLQGQELWGEEIDFEAEHEGFNSYILHDGTKLKVKSVVSEIIRLEIFNPDGDPVYLVKATNLVAAVVPENLRKKE